MTNINDQEEQDNTPEENNAKPKKKQIEIEIDNNMLCGCYSNLSISSFNQEEFCLDFAYIHPPQDKGKIGARVILSPQNTKRLREILNVNINTYEKKFGTIQINQNEPPPQGIHLSFN